jgi:hypothetical protein
MNNNRFSKYVDLQSMSCDDLSITTWQTANSKTRVAFENGDLTVYRPGITTDGATQERQRIRVAFDNHHQAKYIIGVTETPSESLDPNQDGDWRDLAYYVVNIADAIRYTKYNFDSCHTDR